MDRVPDSGWADPVATVTGSPQSWQRVKFFNDYMAGTRLPVELDLVPGCAPPIWLSLQSKTGKH
jgi:hypothetical protein